jgi:hypothetical protein
MRVLLCICCVPAVLSAQNNLKTTVTLRYFNGIRRNLEAAADAMPAAKYGFKLTDGQMSFAEWINHSAERNYSDCATLKTEAEPDAAKKVAGLIRQGGSEAGVERFVRVLRCGARRNRRSKGSGLATNDVLAAAHRGTQQRDLREHRRVSAFQRHRATLDGFANGPKRQEVV